ncbi:biotin-dependent carboxyltransferase family protein [Thalassobaculum sp.]|uniref:5-oxoprolinase subunit C family protein n=1 Tax=Thalassobaculum sp. TaxID=2022740 RepID=UPI0032EB0D23
MNRLRIVKGGPWVSIQDLGRPGFQRFGLSESGAMDPVSLRIANRLVANPDGAGALEIGVLGMELVADSDPLTLSAVGPDIIWLVDGHPVAPNRSLTVERGSRVAVRPGRSSAYAYLGVRGGIQAPSIFGSVSFHGRSGVGGLDGQPLQEGSLIPVRPGTSPQLELGGPLVHGEVSADIGVIEGPQSEHFLPGVREMLVSTLYRISVRSDRMGVRLEGPTLTHTEKGYNIVSDGIALGSIQVPGNGQPIVLGADRQTTGGYPKIAVIARADMFRFAQRPPGATVRFRPTSAEQGADGLRRLAGYFDRLVLRPVAPALNSERLLGLNLIDGGVWD